MTPLRLTQNNGPFTPPTQGVTPLAQPLRRLPQSVPQAALQLVLAPEEEGAHE